jgi:hypothetical protein
MLNRKEATTLGELMARKDTLELSRTRLACCGNSSRYYLLRMTVAFVLLAVLQLSMRFAVGQENQNHLNLCLLPTTKSALSQLQRQYWNSSTVELRTVVAQIREDQPVALWIDRRVDPSQIVELKPQSDSTTLSNKLSEIAKGCGCKGGLIENVYLIAPASRLARIQRSAVVLHGQIASASKSLARQEVPLQWPEISTYRELLDLIIENWQIEISGGELIPHDLMHFGSLPPCSLATQLSLLLGGFDLQAVIDKTATRTDKPRLKIKALAEGVAWQDIYPRSPAPSQLNELRQSFPEVIVEQLGKNIKLNGETNAHLSLLAIGVAPNRNNKSPTITKPTTPQRMVKSFSPEEPAPVESILKYLGEQFKLSIEWSTECTANDRTRLIQPTATNVTPAELIQKVCEAAKLDVEFQSDSKAVIRPKKP